MSSKPEVDLLAVVCDDVEQPRDVGEDGHCFHHTHDEECGYAEFGDCYDGDDDDCVHCECCCTCLGREYGPRDGMLLYPDGAPWAKESSTG